MDKITILKESAKLSTHASKKQSVASKHDGFLKLNAKDFLSDMEREEFDDIDDVHNVFVLLGAEDRYDNAFSA
jgi:hypothetical protein